MVITALNNETDISGLDVSGDMSHNTCMINMLNQWEFILY